MARIAVLGGAGFIGSHLVDRLIYDNHEVVVLDNLCRGKSENVHPDAEFHYQDLARGYAYPISTLIADVDVIFHLAAKVTGIEYNRKHHLDMLQENLKLNSNVLEVVKKVEPELYVFVSTACVYPHDAPVPTPEASARVCDPEPTNFGYGVAKWVGEQQARLLAKEHDISTMIVRFFNAFGLRDYYDPATSHVCPALIHKAFNAVSELHVWGSGNQTRVFVDARDIADTLVELMECPEAHDAQAVNIGHSGEIAIGEVAEIVNNMVAGGNLSVVYHLEKPEGYPRRAADTTRLELLIGHREWTPFKVTIMDMIDDYTERFDVT